MTDDRLKYNNDKTEVFVVGFHRRVSVSQDSHLRVASHDVSVKSHVIDHIVVQRILRSEELALFAIS